MALLFAGSSRCVFCDEVLDDREEFSAFPAFIGDQADPLFRISDSGFHTRCLNQSDDGRKAMTRYQEWTAKTGPGKRKCAVCGEEIMDYRDYILIPYLCSPEVHPVGAFNYTHLHRSHLPAWRQQSELVELLNDGRQRGIVSFDYADRLLKDFE